MSNDSLKRKIALYDSAISFFRIKIQGLPKGTLKSVLVHRKEGNLYQYYCRSDGYDATGRYLTKEEIDECFDYKWFLRNVDMIFERFGL